MAGYPTGFPLPAGVFSGGGSLGAKGRFGFGLEDYLNALLTYIATRGIYANPAALATISDVRDGDLAVVRESAGPGTPPALYVYDGDTTTWKNLLSTGLPANHASTHQNGGADEVATATPGANAIPKAGAGAKLGIGWLPTGATVNDVCIGNDARLSDARTPTAHTHGNGDLTGASAVPAAATIPISGAANEIDNWGAAPTGAIGVVWAVAVPTTIRGAIDRIATAVSGLLAPGGIP